ncbi:sensor histidine kinase [Mucilaginibacter ginkgonis]|uniref:Sensor histidine kinase n=1 Tax=Mucilaginibacter ginkgonis TaxID=2682091 RepID=A0A6I4HVV8_9SPHI|nr:sensor histidine kinase [Mucilaginibacter ginkgonis]QQL50237.1 sensor histidine kinase [Mucilaginibacter ginkgonis]
MRRSNAATTIIHAAGWLIFLAFPLLFMNKTQENKHATLFILASPFYWLFCLTYIFMFYINAWYLVPRFVFRKRYVVYGVIILLLMGLVYFLQPFDNLLENNSIKNAHFRTTQTQLPVMHDSTLVALGTDTASTGKGLMFGPLPHQDMRMQDPQFKSSNKIFIIHQSGNIDLVALFIFIIVVGLSIAITTVEKWQFTESMVGMAQAEKARAELSFLKAQINPHFLFNTLNNIYALSVTGNPNTSESIMKLSNIMRYVTDEVAEDLVLLQSEIDCIKDYIDLQKLRLGKKTKLSFSVTGEVVNQRIAPLVLMTFIENVFKYGISKHEETVIDITLEVDDCDIKFFCANTIFEKGAANRKGIGITNTRQRLQYIYNGKHTLDIKTVDNRFVVKLDITC